MKDGKMDNIPLRRVMDAVKKTVRKIFEERIQPTRLYEKYREELERQQLIADAVLGTSTLRKRQVSGVLSKYRLMVSSASNGAVTTGNSG